MSKARLDLHIPIDSSGRELPTSRTPALQVYAASDTEETPPILTPASSVNAYKNWNRIQIAEWLSSLDERGFLRRYFDPSLTDEERTIADLEGWIPGIM